MRRACGKIIVLWIFLLAVAVSSQTRQPCAVLRAIDYSRVELTSGEIIGLLGMQAFPNSPASLIHAKALLDSLTIGKAIEFEVDENISARLVYLWHDSMLINVELLRRGLTQFGEDTASFKFKNIFLAAANEAKENGRGHWKFTPSIEAATNADDDTVYVTQSGKRYHAGNCRLLLGNKMAVPLSQARLNHHPCLFCITSPTTPTTAKSLQSPDKTVTSRCFGKTKNGERCKRAAEANAKYCWQHRRK